MQSGQAATAQELPLRPQDELECRRCEVHCDKVVYPAACVSKACPFLYAIEEFGHRYIGCMQKVFDVEIDADLLAAAERSRSGFGAVKTVRKPLPMCKTQVDQCYESRRRSTAPTRDDADAARKATRHDALETSAANQIGMIRPPIASTVCW